MRKAFTLAETLISMLIIGIILAISIPVVIQNTNDTAPRFKKAYNTVEETVSELVNDPSLYPTGDLTNPAHGATIPTCSDADATAGKCFCQNFFSKLNIVGTVNCSDRTWVFTDASQVSIPNEPNPDTDATTTNGMQWFDFHPWTGAPETAATGWNKDNCDAPDTWNYTDIDTTNVCVHLTVDINGSGKGANIMTYGAANRDIFHIYITNTGRVTVPLSTSPDPDEYNLLQK